MDASKNAFGRNRQTYGKREKMSSKSPTPKAVPPTTTCARGSSSQAAGGRSSSISAPFKAAWVEGTLRKDGDLESGGVAGAEAARRVMALGSDDTSVEIVEPRLDIDVEEPRMRRSPWVQPDDDGEGVS
jgi:hypothetical protein